MTQVQPIGGQAWPDKPAGQSSRAGLSMRSSGRFTSIEEAKAGEQTSETGLVDAPFERVITAAFPGQSRDVVKSVLECLVDHGITKHGEWREVAGACQAHNVLADICARANLNTLMLVRLEKALNGPDTPGPRCTKPQRDIPARSFPLKTLFWQHVLSDPFKMWEWFGTVVYSRAWLERLTFVQQEHQLRETLYGSANDTVIVVALYVSFLINTPTTISMHGAGSAPIDVILFLICINGSFVAVLYILLKLTSKEIYSVVSDENLAEFVRATPDLDLMPRRLYVVLNYTVALSWSIKLCEPFRHTDPQKASWLFHIRGDDDGNDDAMPSWLFFLGIALNLVVYAVGFTVLIWHCGAAGRLALHSGAYDVRPVLPDEALSNWSAAEVKQAFVDVALTQPVLLTRRQGSKQIAKASRALSHASLTSGRLSSTPTQCAALASG